MLTKPMPIDIPRSVDWSLLSDDQQLALSREALCHAADKIAGQAETLAAEMEVGALADHGGVDALRLFAALVRVNGHELTVDHMAAQPGGHAAGHA